MKQLTRVLATAVLAGLLTGPALADDEAKPQSDKKPAAAGEEKSKSPKAAERAKQAEQRRLNQGLGAFFRLPEAIKLTDQQQEQVAALKKQYTPKIREITGKQRSLLTDQQKQVQRETRQKLQEDGTKGKKAQQTLAAALNLSEEQKKQDAGIKAARSALQKEIHGKVVSLLTDEQKALLPQRGRQAKKAKAPAADGTQPKRKKKTEAAGDN